MRTLICITGSSIIAAVLSCLAPQTFGECLSKPALQAGNDPNIGNDAAIPGYRLIGSRWDPVLGYWWAILENCNHPERPQLALPIASALPVPPGSHIRSAKSSASSGVRAGDKVLLRTEEANVRIEADAIAEENALSGGIVHIRLLHVGVAEGGTAVRLAAVVRGPGIVEIKR